MARRQYTVKEVDAAIAVMNIGKSVRETAEFLNIPKSVIGRWKKNPEEWKIKYAFHETKNKIKSKKRKASLLKFQKKVNKAKKENPDKYKGLTLHYDEEKDSYEAETG